MTSKYTNKNGVKLLAVVMVLAMAFAAIIVSGSTATDASDDSTPTPITGEKFLEGVKDNTITLTEDIILSSQITITETLTVDLAGYSITNNSGKVFYIDADNVTLSINDSSKEKTGSVVSSSYAVSTNLGTHHTGVTVDLNGGSYSGTWAIILAGDAKKANVFTFDDITVNATVCGLWLSYKPIKQADINNVNITSDNIGIYLAKADKATVKNTVVNSVGTAIEVKDGSDIKITDCTLTSSTYEVADKVGHSESGGAVTTVNINNGYASADMNVTITGGTITNTASGSKPVIITDDSVIISYNDDGSVKSTTVSANYNINFTWTDHDSDVTVVYCPNNTSVLEDKWKKTDAEVMKNYITVNGTTFIPDEFRLDEAVADSKTNLALCNNLSITLTDAGKDVKNLALNGYKFTVTGNEKGELNGKVIGAPENGNESAATFTKYILGKTALTISSGSIVLEDGSVVDTTPGSITIIGKAKVVGDTTVGDIILAPGASLSIPADTTLKAESITSTYSGSGTAPVVKVEGTLDTTVAAAQADKLQIQVSTGATIEGSVDESTMAYDGQGKFEFGDTLNSDYTVTKEEYLSSDLIIPAGVTLTIATGGDLNLAKNNILVLGSLIIETGASVSATSGSETIYLVRNCEFSNDGYIGVGGQKVTISADTTAIKTKYTSTTGINYTATGSVSLLQANGAEFSIVKDGSNYVLAVTGDIYTDAVNATITISNAVINGTFTVGENVDAVISGSVKVLANGTVTVDGCMEPAISGTNKVILVNKTSFIVNGIVDNLSVEAQTGSFTTAGGYSTAEGTKTTTVTFPDINPAADVTAGVKGITLSVGTYNYTKTESDGSTTAMTSQRLYISGELSYITVKTDENYETPISCLSIAGNDAYVADDATLVLAKAMNISANLIVQGQVIVNGTTSCPAGLTYVGTSYSITTTSTPKVSTFYIEPFTDAISKIDTVDKKTLKIMDKTVKIGSELTLTEGQVIDIADATDFKISESGILTVNAKAKITGTVDSVEGILKIMTGGSCANAPTKYASYVKATDSIQYSGIIVALNNANAGDVITINNETSISTGDLVIKEGVTVNASKNITVADGNADISGKLVLTDGAKLIVSGTKKNIDVTGEVNATDGDVSISSGRFTSEGKTVLAGTTTLNFENVDAFYYVDEDSNKVITSAQAAIDAASAQDSNDVVYIAGTVSVSELNAKTDLVIGNGAKANLGNVTIGAGKTITLTGKTTGTFSAQTGTEETVGAIETSVISVTEASGITIGAGKTVDSMNVETKVMYIFGILVGKATVDDGVVTVGLNGGTAAQKNLTVDGTATTEAYLIIAERATVAIPNGMTLVAGCNDVSGNVYSAVTVDGTLDFAKGATISASAADDDCFIVINGTVMIGDEAVFAYDGETILNGKVIVSETATKEGTLSVVENIYAYEESAISGKVTISTGKYIMAMAGADMSAAKMNVDATGTSAAFATAFMINGDKYMDVYTINGVSIYTLINDVDFSIEGLNLSGIGTVTNWYKSETYTDEYKLAAGAVTDKNVPALYFNAPKAEVIGTISAGVGLQIYLNGISVENYKVTGGYKLPVGTYKVNIENLSGYDKSKAVISFNGATVADGGSITVSEKDFVLTATGAVPSVTPTPEPTPIQPSEKDDSMGITEYLLIVLVILAAILVVVVAIRMMRS